MFSRWLKLVTICEDIIRYTLKVRKFKQLDDNTGWILEYGKQKHFLLDSYTTSNKYRSGTYFLYNKPFIWTLNKNVFNLPDLNISDNQTTFNSRICSKYYTSANSNFPARPYFQMPTWLPRFSQFRHRAATPQPSLRAGLPCISWN